MRIAVRYQSQGGNTRVVAQAIANAAGVTAEPLGIPLKEPVDLLFIGGGIYAGTLDRSLKDYLSSLDPNNIKSIAAFSTSGIKSGAGSIATIAEKAGIHVCEKQLSLKFGFHRSKGNDDLTDKQKQLIDDFVKETLE